MFGNANLPLTVVILVLLFAVIIGVVCYIAKQVINRRSSAKSDLANLRK